MNWIAEHPWQILIAGIVAEICLAIALVRTGRRALIAAMLGVLAVTAGLLVAERMMVTDVEQIEATLDELAKTVAKNDAPGVVAFIVPTETGIRGYVETVMRRIVIKEAKIVSDVEITVDRSTTPVTAVATFAGHLTFKDTRGEVPYNNYLERFEVALVKDGERWLITGYKEHRRGR